MLARWLRHIHAAYWRQSRLLPSSALTALAAAVASAELGHRGEISLVIEASLTPLQLLQRMSPRERALEVFSQSRIWDTEHNSGVLVHVLLGDHAVEIVSDRGLAMIGAGEWEAIVSRFKAAFASPTGDDADARDAGQGCAQALAALGELLRRHLPASDANPDELPDPVRLL